MTNYSLRTLWCLLSLIVLLERLASFDLFLHFPACLTQYSDIVVIILTLLILLPHNNPSPWALLGVVGAQPQARVVGAQVHWLMEGMNRQVNRFGDYHANHTALLNLCPTTFTTIRVGGWVLCWYRWTSDMDTTAMSMDTTYKTHGQED